MRVVVGASRNRNRFYGLCHLRDHKHLLVKNSQNIFFSLYTLHI